MADKIAMGTVASEAPETSVGDHQAITVEPGAGKDGAALVSRDAKGATLQMGDEPGAAPEITREDNNEFKKDGADAEAAPQGDTPPVADAPAPLPEYAADNPEVVSQYEERFVKDGQLNMDALSADYTANAKVGTDGKVQSGLTKNTLAFLASKGITEAMARQVEAGQLALASGSTAALYAQAGGEDKLRAAIAWGKANGYDAKRFNAAINAGGADALDAVDLLMSRYSKANPTQRAAAPTKTLTDKASGGTEENTGTSGAGYATYADWQADDRKYRPGGPEANPKKHAEVKAKLKLSSWVGKHQ